MPKDRSTMSTANDTMDGSRMLTFRPSLFNMEASFFSSRESQKIDLPVNVHSNEKSSRPGKKEEENEMELISVFFSSPFCRLRKFKYYLHSAFLQQFMMWPGVGVMNSYQDGQKKNYIL